MRKNRSVPAITVIPELVYDDVEEAIRWLCDAFGCSVRWQAGDHRAQLWVGDGVVVVRDRPGDLAAGEPAPGVHSSILVRVEDADETAQRARGRGARVLRPVRDHPYGERQVTLADLAGHRWTFTQTIADVAPEEWGGVSVDLR